MRLNRENSAKLRKMPDDRFLGDSLSPWSTVRSLTGRHSLPRIGHRVAPAMGRRSDADGADGW